jgi:hypothetical protein
MDQKLITAVLTGALVLWVLYRRVRRNIGRQPVTPVRMQFRMGVLVVVGLLLAIPAARDVNLLAGLLAGTVGGVALGWFGLRHTRFERTDQGVFYTPHTYIGLAVSALLLSRLVYRFFIVYPTMQAASQADQNPFAAFQRSPLTLAIFGVLIGYYVFYYAGVLGTSRNLLRMTSGPAA